MKYNAETYESIRERILTNIDEDIDKREGSYTSNMISPVSAEFAKYYMELDNMLAIMFLDDSTLEYLDKRLSDFGIYRKLGTVARGTIEVLGVVGTKIPQGTIVLSQGGLEFIVESDNWLDEGVTFVDVVAIEVGAEYNILAGHIEKFKSEISGVATVINTEDFKEGTDTETDFEFLERALEIIRKPATSGNVYHYEQWCKEVDGVTDVIVKPLHSGPGTVKCIVSNNGDLVDSAVLTKCINYIEEVRPIGANVTIISPTPLGITITANIELLPGFEYIDAALEFEENLKGYLSSCDGEVIYIRVAGCLGSVEGIRDYTDLLVNGDTTNVNYTDEQIPKLTSIELTEVI